MVELQPSKLTTWVRFPSSAPFLIQIGLNPIFFILSEDMKDFTFILINFHYDVR